MKSRVAIASLTRHRPEMFSDLLESLIGLEWPDNTEPVFIFVENDDQLNIEGRIEQFKKGQPGAEVHVALEPRAGIPVARNRVLDIAVANSVDFLAFVDDDELVLPDWIRKIFRKAVDDNLDLVGGPLELICPEVPLNLWQRLSWKFLLDKNERRVAQANQLEASGLQCQVRIFTNNWLVRMSFVRSSGIRFDESMGLSGGSDSKFYVQSRERGAKTGWARDALLRDRIPLARLTPSYQFRRARDQNMALYFIDGHDKKKFTQVRVIFSLFRRVIRGAIMIIFSIFRQGQGFVDALTSIGAGLGKAYGAFGRQSTHYDSLEPKERRGPL